MFLNLVQSKFQLVSSLSSHQLRKLAKELRAEATETIALRKKCSLWSEASELKKRYKEDKLELIKQIQNFRKFAQGETEMYTEQLDSLTPSELEQLADMMIEFEQKKQSIQDILNNLPIIADK